MTLAPGCDDEREPPMSLRGLADGDDHLGEPGESGTGTFEHRRELGKYHHQQHRNREAGDDQKEGRVNQVGTDPLAKRLIALEVISQTREHVRECVAGLTCAHHADVGGREGCSVVVETIGKRAAALNALQNGLEQLLLGGVRGDVDQELQRLIDGEAGIQEGRQLAGHDGDIAGLERCVPKDRQVQPIEGRSAAATRATGTVRGLDREWHLAPAAQLLNDWPRSAASITRSKVSPSPLTARTKKRVIRRPRG